jgi:hypothetical protein
MYEIEVPWAIFEPKFVDDEEKRIYCPSEVMLTN